MEFARTIVLGWLTIATASAISGCGSPKGPYGADVFLRVHDTNGVPTYKAAGGTESDFLQVIKSACPDGNPQIVDGSTGVSYSVSGGGSWYTVYFTCDHEIPIPPAGSP